MNKAKELVEKLTKLEITQNGSWYESISEEIWLGEFNDKHKVLAEGFGRDKHRWYDTCTTVIEFEDGSIMGIRHVDNIFSESMSIEDCSWEMGFYEMRPITMVSYLIVQ